MTWPAEGLIAAELDKITYNYGSFPLQTSVPYKARLSPHTASLSTFLRFSRRPPRRPHIR